MTLTPASKPVAATAIVKGLYCKYHIAKADGTEIQSGFEVFILRLDDGGDPAHVAASRAAAAKFVYELKGNDEFLSCRDYRITKANGSALDAGFEPLMLRFDKGGNAEQIAASRSAVLVYADEIADFLPELSNQLRARYSSAK